MPGHLLNPTGYRGTRKRGHHRLFSKQGGLCFYCRRRMVLTMDETNPLRFTRDHKRPLAANGFNGASNVVGACNACNQAKADIGFDVFCSIMARAHSIESGHEEARRLRAERDRREAAQAAASGHVLVVDTTFGPVPLDLPGPSS